MTDGIICCVRILPIPSNVFLDLGSIRKIQERHGQIQISEKESRSSPVRIECSFGVWHLFGRRPTNSIREPAPLSACRGVKYVGSAGAKLYWAHNINQPDPGPGAIDPRRPYYNLYPGVAGITWLESSGNSFFSSTGIDSTCCKPLYR
jgi:hypothetical protein